MKPNTPEFYNLIQQEVAIGNVRKSENEYFELYKYTETCAYESKWNDINRQCRGIIYDKKTKELVALPFTKFFNLNEMPETKADQILKDLEEAVAVLYQEKMDGSCGICYWNQYLNRWCMATNGSLESDQAKQGEKILYERYDVSGLNKDYTYIFEIIYPENQIVVNYGSSKFLAHLTTFDIKSCTEVTNLALVDLTRYGFSIPLDYNFSSLSDITFKENHEGYVIAIFFLDKPAKRIKIKSPNYLKIHKLVSLITPKGVIEVIRDKISIDILPVEFKEKFDDIKASILTKFFAITALLNQKVMELDSLNLPDRKAKAIWIQQNVSQKYISLMFSKLDNKLNEDQIYKLIEKEL